MLCAREERLEDRLVRALIEVGASKAETLHKALHTLDRSDSRQSWSLAATYKALRKLEQGGVLVHSKGFYYIAESWVFALSHMIDKFMESSLHDVGGEHLLPPSGGSFSWRYTDLRRLNSFASNVIVVAARVQRVSTIYSWSPHLWFNLVQQEHERRYLQALRELGVRVEKVIGGDSQLDRETAMLLPRGIVSIRFVPRRQLLPRGHYTIVVGDIVVTMKLRRQTTEDIDALFQRAKDIRSVDMKLLLKLFRYDTTPATLTVEHDRAKAQHVIEKFTR